MRLDEFITVPPPGWRGRNRYIARQLLHMAWEGFVFVLLIVALLGAVAITYFGLNGPVPR